MTQIIIPGGGSGSVSAANIEATFTATGQIYQGTGSGTGGLVLPPGYEIGYDQITSSVNVTGTSDTSPTTVISCASHTFDGAPVLLQVFFPYITTPSVAGDTITIQLNESSTIIGQLGQQVAQGSSLAASDTYVALYRFTPTAGAHTYTITSFAEVTTGTPAVGAGTAGSGFVAAFARFTKV